MGKNNRKMKDVILELQLLRLYDKIHITDLTAVLQSTTIRSLGHNPDLVIDNNSYIERAFSTAFLLFLYKRPITLESLKNKDEVHRMMKIFFSHIPFMINNTNTYKITTHLLDDVNTLVSMF